MLCLGVPGGAPCEEGFYGQSLLKLTLHITYQGTWTARALHKASRLPKVTLLARKSWPC